MPGLKLEVAGDGPMRKKILKHLPPNVTYLGYVDDETKHRKIAHAKAFVAAATEDFGISIVEAQSYCTPVIIPSIGGYKETVNNKTGFFFNQKTINDMVSTIQVFHRNNRVFLREDFEKNINHSVSKDFAENSSFRR